MSGKDQRRFVFLALAVLTGASTAGAFQASRIKIDGKIVPGQCVLVKGTTYIPLDALKAAGIGVRMNGATVELTMPTKTATVTGGANQQEGVEGKTGEWLFNGVWRFRVLSVDKAPADRGAGWTAKVEIRNGSKENGYSPGGTGWQGISLVMEDGKSVGAASDAVELSQQGLAQGASNTQTLFFPTESPSKPVRLILRFDPQGVANTPLRFSVPNPTFRVEVKVP